MAFIKDPLFHFILIAVIAYTATAMTSEKLPTANDNDNIILVDKQNFQLFLQQRSKVYGQQVGEKLYQSLTDEKKQLLIDEYIREEALFRQAVSMGLDKNDPLIRQRLVQKLEFLNQEVQLASTELSRNDLETYFSNNADNYLAQAHITLTHIFYKNITEGDQNLQEIINLRQELNNKAVNASASSQHGDRYLYNRNYVERIEPYIGQHFSQLIAAQLFSENTTSEQWIGPYYSIHGAHLFYISKRVASKLPSLDEIYNLVKSDAKDENSKRLTEQRIADLINQYQVQIAL